MELHYKKINVSDLKVGTRVLYIHSDTAFGDYEYVNDSKITRIRSSNSFELEQKNLCDGPWIIWPEKILDIIDYEKIPIEEEIKIGQRYIGYAEKSLTCARYIDITITSIKNQYSYYYIDSTGISRSIAKWCILKALKI